MLRNVSGLSIAGAVLAGALLAAGLAAVLMMAQLVLSRGHVQVALPAGPVRNNTIVNAMELTAASVPQGGAFAVEIHSDALVAANARFLGRDYPLVDTAGTWFALLAAGQPVGTVTVVSPGNYPVDVKYQLRGTKTVATETLSLTVTPVNFPTDAIDVSADLLRLTSPELEAEEGEVLKAAYAAFTPRQRWNGPFIEPVSGEVTTVFAAKRSYNGGPVSGSHEGIDIAVPLGTPVHASAAGTVSWTGELPDRGQGVIIDHGLGVFTGYYHLSEIRATLGQAVAQGDVIGLAGTTGFSTGPHVHWEVVLGESNVDGLLFEKLNFP